MIFPLESPPRKTNHYNGEHLQKKKNRKRGSLETTNNCQAQDDPNENRKNTKYSASIKFDNDLWLNTTSRKSTIEVDLFKRKFNVQLSCTELNKRKNRLNRKIREIKLWQYKNPGTKRCQLENTCFRRRNENKRVSPKSDPLSCKEAEDPNKKLAPYSISFLFADGTWVNTTSQTEIVGIDTLSGDWFYLDVSCSDPFTNGYGTLKGPYKSLGHQKVIRYQIWKYKSVGTPTCTLEKTCYNIAQLPSAIASPSNHPSTSPSRAPTRNPTKAPSVVFRAPPRTESPSNEPSSNNFIVCPAEGDPNLSEESYKYSVSFLFDDGTWVNTTSSEAKLGVDTLSGAWFEMDVSCTDNFLGGFGSIDGPVESMNHPGVVSYQIWIYKNVGTEGCQLEETCQNAAPSASPSLAPSQYPSFFPSQSHSENPSNTPSNSPVAVLGLVNERSPTASPTSDDVVCVAPRFSPKVCTQMQETNGCSVRHEKCNCQDSFAAGTQTVSERWPARGEGTCFTELGKNHLNGDQWGWSLGPLSDGNYSFPLYSSAFGCDTENVGYHVGNVFVRFDAEKCKVKVIYSVDECFEMNAVNLYISTDDNAVPAALQASSTFTTQTGTSRTTDSTKSGDSRSKSGKSGSTSRSKHSTKSQGSSKTSAKTASKSGSQDSTQSASKSSGSSATTRTDSSSVDQSNALFVVDPSTFTYNRNWWCRSDGSRRYTTTKDVPHGSTEVRIIAHASVCAS